MQINRIVLIILLLMSVVVHASPYLTLNAGFSKDIRLKTENKWQWGLSLGSDLYSSDNVVKFGIHLGYNKWSVDDNYYGASENEDITGSQSVLEIIPSMRITLPGKVPAGIPYIQLGFGFYQVNISDIQQKFLFWQNTMLVGESSLNLGIQIGGGLELGKRFEFLVLSSIYNRDGSLYWHNSFQFAYRIL